jgi:hypothetical protein
MADFSSLDTCPAVSLGRSAPLGPRREALDLVDLVVQYRPMT